MGTQPVSISRKTDAWNYAAASSRIVDTATVVTIKAAVRAGVRNDVTDLKTDTAILGAATELAIRDSAGGSALWRCRFQTAAPPIMSVNFQSPLVGSPNTLLEVVTPTSVTGDVFVNAQGYAGS
jgi:hypothetical protein